MPKIIKYSCLSLLSIIILLCLIWYSYHNIYNLIHGINDCDPHVIQFGRDHLDLYCMNNIIVQKFRHFGDFPYILSKSPGLDELMRPSNMNYEEYSNSIYLYSKIQSLPDVDYVVTSSYKDECEWVQDDDDSSIMKAKCKEPAYYYVIIDTITGKLQIYSSMDEIKSTQSRQVFMDLLKKSNSI